jgi:hypothetical protein
VKPLDGAPLGALDDGAAAVQGRRVQVPVRAHRPERNCGLGRVTAGQRACWACNCGQPATGAQRPCRTTVQAADGAVKQQSRTVTWRPYARSIGAHGVALRSCGRAASLTRVALARLDRQALHGALREALVARLPRWHRQLQGGAQGAARRALSPAQDSRARAALSRLRDLHPVTGAAGSARRASMFFASGGARVPTSRLAGGQVCSQHGRTFSNTVSPPASGVSR